MTTLQLILATALASSLLTSALLYALFRWRLLPELEARMAAAREDFSRSIERSVRKGLLDGVSALPSREVLQDTTRTIARTGMELVGDSLTAWLGGARRGRRSSDRAPGEPPANDQKP